MSTILNTHASCPVFQAWLTDYFATCPMSRRPGSPLFNFLYSDANRSLLREVVNPRPGRKREVELVYDQPVVTTDVSAVESCDRICDATTERGDATATYSIECTDGLYVEEKWTLSDWNDSCRSDGDILMRKLANMLDGLMAAMYEKVASEMPPLFGGWSGDVNSGWVDADDFLQVKTEVDSSTNPNWGSESAWQRISMAKTQSGYCLPTFITGGTDLFMYYQLSRVGCCADNGIDALAALNTYGEVTTYDRYVAAEFGNDVSLMLQAGSTQLLTYNAVTPAIVNLGGLGELDMTYRNYFEAIIQDPLTGFPVDLSIKSECGVVHIVMTATAKPVALPFTLYPEGHPNEGVNFATAVQVVNA